MVATSKVCDVPHASWLIVVVTVGAMVAPGLPSNQK
jgi:hypothetical protein